MGSMGISGNANKILLYWYPDMIALEIENPLLSSDVLIKALKKNRPQQIFIESGTGIEIPLSAILWESSFSIFIVSGRQVSDFARSIDISSVEDRNMHSSVLARFSEYSMLSDKKTLDRESERQLKSLVLRRRQLIDMNEAEKRNKYRSSKYVTSKITTHILWLSGAIKQLDTEISGLIRSSSVWRVNEKIKPKKV